MLETLRFFLLQIGQPENSNVNLLCDVFGQSKQINQHNPSRILHKIHQEIKNPQDDTKNFSNKKYLEGPTKKDSTKLG